MNISPRAVFGSGNGLGAISGQPPTAINTGGYRYQPGTILTTLNPAPTTPTFGTSFSPPAVASIGNLWGGTPPTASGNAYSPNLVKSVGVAFNPTPPATNTGGGGFFQAFTNALFG